MEDRFVRRSGKTGLSPGSLIHVGEKKMHSVPLTLFRYADGKPLTEHRTYQLEECLPFTKPPGVTWLNVDGLHDVGLIEEIGTHAGIHPLLVEDILNTNQRPKIDESDEIVFIVLQMFYWNDITFDLESEQVSLVLGASFVLTFQEEEDYERDVFEPVRKRLRDGTGHLKERGADYLAYSLLDAVVDHYFVILENLDDRIEALERELIAEPARDTLQVIYQLKRDTIILRKSLWPLREIVSSLVRGGMPQFQESTLIFVRDIYDHTIQILDAVETFREMLLSMQDIYLSNLSNRLNEVMKVLTVIATIFIPLTFIVGVYGMNFRYMPELEWRWGYYAVLLIMTLIVVGMIAYFRRRKWL